MIKLLPKLGFILSFQILIAALLISAKPIFAGSANLYLSPGSQTVAQGNTFTVSVRTNISGDSANAVQAYLNYPTASLDFVRINTAGTSFEIQAENGGGSGNVQIVRGSVSGVSGDKFVASVTFRAKVSTGTASISLTDASKVVSSSSNANGFFR